MAWAVIGGLVTSTVLTLVVIPCIYMLFGQMGIRWNSRKKAAVE
jgi:Cu(I)/Ag(I) efflux system membrane protein CusA/SilA